MDFRHIHVVQNRLQPYDDSFMKEKYEEEDLWFQQKNVIFTSY